MGWFDWFVRGRERYLGSSESERAFAPDPTVDYWPLADRPAKNGKAYEFVRKNHVELIHVETGNLLPILDFPCGLQLFATMWDPYSAKAIGNLCRQVERDDELKFRIVFFENSRDEVLEHKKDSWYLKQSFVLAPQSFSLRELIGRVPFRVLTAADGMISDIVEGKDW